jgi:nicotinamide-nucleotide amidase
MTIENMNSNSKINNFIKTLLEKKLTLAFAESMTCGLAAHKLSTVKGTSEVLKGSIVCYTEDVKKGLLRVSPALIKKYSCESMEVTESLVKNLSKIIDADIYASITGLASDGGTERKGKPVGTVFFCVKKGKRLIKEKKVFRGTPLQIREKACFALYDLILEKIKT